MAVKEVGLKQERLSKTSAEQSILRNLEALEEAKEDATEDTAKSELDEQISLLREQLMRVRGRGYSEVEKENSELKERVRELETELLSVKGKCDISDVGSAVNEHEKSDIFLKHQHKLYKLLLTKYSETINKVEKKTVGEIKALIDDSDLSLQNILDGVKPEGYAYEKNYLEAVRNVFEYITKNINYIDSNVNINFWLSPKEIISEKVGDDEDLAVFLCSLLYGLGDKRAEVVISEMEDLRTHSFVITEYQGKFMLLDPSRKEKFDEFTGTKSEVLAKYNFSGAKIKRFMYKFNRNNYEQFL